MKSINELLESLKIKVSDVSLFETAFTHSSYNGDAKTKHHDYERLEFLGDSVLGCVVSELAYKTHAEMDQGRLTKLKSAVVQSKSLFLYAKELHFDEYIRVGSSFANKISESRNLLEDVFEAFIGALYLTKGFKVARKFLIDYLYSDVQRFDISDLQDYKTQLQEAMQTETRESVTYVVKKESGPSHDKTFVVDVLFEGMVLGTGEGKSKKEAEQNAAKKALAKKVSKK